MQVIVVAFNKEGYQKEILRFDDVQIWRQDSRISISTQDILEAGGIVCGMGAAIDPADFPEMVRFVVKIVG